MTTENDDDTSDSNILQEHFQKMQEKITIRPDTVKNGIELRLMYMAYDGEWCLAASTPSDELGADEFRAMKNWILAELDIPTGDEIQEIPPSEIEWDYTTVELDEWCENPRYRSNFGIDESVATVEWDSDEDELVVDLADRSNLHVGLEI